MSEITDTRADIAATHEWITTLLAHTSDEQLDAPTPCTEFDVRALTEHLNAVSDKLRTVAEGGNPHDRPFRVPVDPGRLADQYAAGAAEARAAWADDALLTATVTAPYGPVPGHVALSGFLMELVAHGWDLAVATGQESETDPAVVARAQALAEQAVSDEARGPGMPFGEQVEPRPGAGPTERLAAYLGRARP